MRTAFIMLMAILITAPAMGQQRALNYKPLVSGASGDTLFNKDTTNYILDLNTAATTPTIHANGQYSVLVIFRADSNKTNKAPRGVLQYATGRTKKEADKNKAVSDTLFTHGLTAIQWRPVFVDSLRGSLCGVTRDTILTFPMADRLYLRLIIPDTNFSGGVAASKCTTRVTELTIGTK